MSSEPVPSKAKPRYRILKRLMAGAQGEEFLAQHPTTGKQVLLRVLPLERVGDAAQAKRLVEQLKRLGTLEHPGLLRYQSAFLNSKGAPCVVMERLEATPLADRIARGPLPPREAKRLALALCGALGFLHKQSVVHGELHAANVVLVAGERNEATPKLTGYGLELGPPTQAAPPGEGPPPKSRGAPLLAPECLTGGMATPRSDLFALGALLYELLSGAPPFSPARLAAAVRSGKAPPRPPLTGEAEVFEPLLAGLLRLDPAQRLGSAELLARQLEQVKVGAAATTEPPAEDDAATVPIVRGGAPERPPPRPKTPKADPAARTFGDYLLEKKIGAGGMGEVWQARHRETGTKVAVKFLLPHVAEDQETVSRFINEARAANAIAHENIVQVFDSGEEFQPERRVYCAMELLEGRSLSQEMKRKPLTLARIHRVVGQLCQALSAAHWAGVVHRDIKPANLHLIEKDGAKDFVKVLDFGVAKVAWAKTEGGAMTRTGTALGTPEYMAPEQAMATSVDRRTDVYATGMVLYELLAGHRPFRGEGVGQLLMQVVKEPPPPLPATTASGEPMPRALAELVLRCLEKRPDDRPQTMDELAKLLEKARTNTETLAAVAKKARQAKVRVAVRKVLLVGALVGVSAIAIRQYGGPKATWNKVRLLASGQVVKLLSPEAPPPPVSQMEAVKIAEAERKAVEAKRPLTVILAVESNPEGAQVTRVDTGEPLGLTPVDVTVAKGGQATLRLEKEGYVSAESTVSLNADVQLSLPLAPATAAPPPRHGSKKSKPAAHGLAAAQTPAAPVPASAEPAPVAVVTHPAVLRLSPSPTSERPEPSELRLSTDGSDLILDVRFNRPAWGKACEPKCTKAMIFIDTDDNAESGLRGDGKDNGADLVVQLEGLTEGEGSTAESYVRLRGWRTEGIGRPTSGPLLMELDSRHSGRVRLRDGAVRLRLDATVGPPLGASVRVAFQTTGGPWVSASGTGFDLTQAGVVETLRAGKSDLKPVRKHAPKKK